MTVSALATLDVDASLTIGSIAGAGDVDVANAQTLTAGNSSNQSFSGVMSGAGSFTKQNSGTLELSGANTFSGTMSITGGTVTASVDQALANSVNVTLSNGAALDVEQDLTIAELTGSGTSNRDCERIQNVDLNNRKWRFSHICRKY